MDEETLLRRHILDLAKKAWQQNVYQYTNFLSPAEQDALQRMRRELDFIHWETFGGNEACERQIAGFGSEEEMGYPGVFPIALLEVAPAAEKFAEPLTHRDYLGALLNLGIVRGLLGDIVVRPNRAYVYCVDSIADYIQENLTKVKHTYVKVSAVGLELEEVKPVLVPVKKNVASERLDVIAAALCGCSRSQVLELFRTKKIFVNGKVEENHSGTLKEKDVLSIRGTGKFIYEGVQAETKKGRYTVTLLKYS
jgi:RNA-binding protein YlmH